MTRILIVDDEFGIRDLLSDILEDEGYDVQTAEDAAHARDLVKRMSFDLILLDIWMPDTDGITLLKEWGSAHAINCPVVMMSGHGTIETAMEATRYGAIDFLEKPIALQKLLTTCRNVIEEWRTQHRGGAAQNAPMSAQNAPRPAAAGGLQPQVRVSADGSYCRLSGTVPVPNPSGRIPAVEVTDLGIVLDFNRSLRELRDDFERAYLTRVLRLEGGSIAALAKHANVERTHLYRKLRNLGLDVSALTQSDSSGAELPVYGRGGAASDS